MGQGETPGWLAISYDQIAAAGIAGIALRRNSTGPRPVGPGKSHQSGDGGKYSPLITGRKTVLAETEEFDGYFSCSDRSSAPSIKWFDSIFDKDLMKRPLAH